MSNDILAKKNRRVDPRKESRLTTLNRLCGDLPDCVVDYLMETAADKALSTRVEYAREIGWFLDYLIDFWPDFCDMQRTDFTYDDFAKVKPGMISRYLSLSLDGGASDRTVSRKRASISSLYRYMEANKRIEWNPVPASAKVRMQKRDEVIHLDMDEQEKFLNAVDTGDFLTDKEKKLHARFRLRDLALVTLFLDTGLRISELSGTDRADYDFETCSVVVLRKENKVQTVYYSDDTRDALESYWEERKAADQTLLDPKNNKVPFFASSRGGRLGVRAIEKIVAKYAAGAVPGKHITPHKLRSSYAMGYYGETKDILSLQRKLGHSSLSATNIYAKATDEKMRQERNVMQEARRRRTNNNK